MQRVYRHEVCFGGSPDKAITAGRTGGTSKVINAAQRAAKATAVDKNSAYPLSNKWKGGSVLSPAFL